MDKIATLNGYLRVEQWCQSAADELYTEYDKKTPNVSKIEKLEEKIKKYEKMMDEFENSGKFDHKEYCKASGDFWAFR